MKKSFLFPLIMVMASLMIPGTSAFGQKFHHKRGPLKETENIYTVPALDGKKTIVQAKSLFSGFIDPKFVKWGLDQPGPETPETEVQEYEVIASASVWEMFSCFDLGMVCLTQDQIMNYCQANRSDFKKLWQTKLFLTEKDFNLPAEKKNLFVIGVYAGPNGFGALLFKPNDKQVWRQKGLNSIIIRKIGQ